MCKVSICIPAYNDPAGIERLLNSIKIQDFNDHEVIITDDSTNDEVAHIVERSGMDINYIRNISHDGSTANWNKAIDLAKGQYIKIMHHDDWFTDETSLGKLVELLDENENAVMAFSGTNQVSSSGTYSRFTSKEDADLIGRDWRNLFLGNTIGAPSAVIHRACEKRYDSRLKWLVDMDFYMDMLKDGKTFVYTQEPLISIGMSDDQITQNCITNGELNCFEYRYVFDKYSLGSKQEYIDKLFSILLLFDAPVSYIAGTGIDKGEYKRARLKKFGGKIKDKLHAL